MKFGKKGSCDIIGFLSDGRFLGIEVKTGTGRLTKHQQAFHKIATGFGCLIIEARSVDQVVTILDSLGLRKLDVHHL